MNHGATRTSKTVLLRVMAENLSRIGVPVFTADATGDFSEFETLDLAESNSARGANADFVRGARWALLRVAAWLEATRFEADDEESQRAMDATKSLIAEHAKQAAAKYRSKKTAANLRSTK